MPLNYIIEHMEDDLHDWCLLEYCHLTKSISPSNLYFTNLSEIAKATLSNKEILREANFITADIVDSGLPMDKICLLDPSSKQTLKPEDGNTFDYYLFGGILGDDPPRDRTSELRKHGFQTRNLGDLQMTTDTAINVTKRIVEDKVAIDEIPFIDYPEIKMNNNESVIMPFRYVAIPSSTKSTLQTTNNELKHNLVPLLPEGMIELLKKDADMKFEF
ncbi:8009_t:CDS:2 [Acaulospora morrowiae]|uniref:8009_t:CDS:1 n=1 Tax=Acaulospora morrowiae TaxID=94023 RepID=A0A9N8ZPA0_9GLOM|nr:8009_t:CDS:2 [Acaulospora morrowiae]